MSLVATASTWTNDESSNKKKIPSIRKTVKLRPPGQLNEFNSGNEVPESIEQFQNSSEHRSSRVNDLLNKISSSSDDGDNNKMGDFKPLSPPEINVKGDYADDSELKQYLPSMPTFSRGAASSNILGEMKNYVIHWY